jgi:polysaccharide biosynthesis/export protein
LKKVLRGSWKMKKVQIVPNKSFIGAVIYGIFIFSAIILTGCDDNNRILDPSQVGRFRPVPAVNVILDSLGVEEETPPAWADAEESLPEDGISQEGDYTFGSGDIIRVSIFELLADGAPFENSYVVDESGKITIPEVGAIDVAGMSERQLEEEMRSILQPNILKNPLVTITLLQSPKLKYSIAGAGIRSGGRFDIPRYDFRLLDALALAGGTTQFNVSTIYVSRLIKEKGKVSAPAGQDLLGGSKGEELPTPEQEMLKMLMPTQKDKEQTTEKRAVITSSEMATEDELAKTASPEDLDILSQIAGLKTKPTDQTGKVEWIFRDGKYVAVPVAEEGGTTQEVEQTRQLKQEQKKPAAEGPKARLIKIPVDKLVTGDPKYNIVIREGDVIHVPVDLIGEFCVTGNITNKAGFFELTGRPLTLKMAIAAAGGLGPLAWPKHCEITRRIGKDREETVMVDLDKIARGEQPDFFIKPNDLINVGTHPTSQWRYALQNAFRATYGFGFLYDRNFAQQSFGTTTDRPFGIQHPLGPFGF